MAGQGKKINVLMLPWLGHGHTTPYLELAKKLSTRNFHIYFCSTPANLNSIKNKNTPLSSIQFVDLHLPSSPELPPQLHTTNGLPPRLMPALKTAFESSAAQFSDIVESLHPDLVIYDFNQPWAAEIAAFQGIPAVEFVTIGAAMVAFGLHVMRNAGGGEEFPFPEIFLREYEKKKMLKNQGDNDRILRAMELSREIFLMKTCREIEGRFIDYLSQTCDKKFVPVGPLVPDDNDDRADGDESVGEIEAWLDGKEKGSVVFASFGSEYFLTEKERHAISHGLELSGASFIWALRFPAGDEITGMPEGFLDRVKNRGKIVEGWAPQERILKHRSTGAFLSHCGWCSVMESLKWGGGVPIVAVPMHSDQPVNARVVEAAGIGVEAVRGEAGDLRGEEIAAAIRKVMVEEGGEGFRRKVKELGGKLAVKGAEEIDDVCMELARVCQKVKLK